MCVYLHVYAEGAGEKSKSKLAGKFSLMFLKTISKDFISSGLDPFPPTLLSCWPWMFCSAANTQTLKILTLCNSFNSGYQSPRWRADARSVFCTATSPERPPLPAGLGSGSYTKLATSGNIFTSSYSLDSSKENMKKWPKIQMKLMRPQNSTAESSSSSHHSG